MPAFSPYGVPEQWPEVPPYYPPVYSAFPPHPWALSYGVNPASFYFQSPVYNGGYAAGRTAPDAAFEAPALNAPAADEAHLLRSEGGAAPIRLKDYGPAPFVVNLKEAAVQNKTFRTALWTGEHVQVTVMSIDVGDDIGLEVHPHTDQLIRIEQGRGLAQMGDAKTRLDFERDVGQGDAIMIPAGKWHNVINTGNTPLKVSVVYAPPEHPRGTVHKTKADAQEAESGGKKKAE
jgi:mannose-6-phosphate isomerase-like protein (cupin superfamily)